GGGVDARGHDQVPDRRRGALRGTGGRAALAKRSASQLVQPYLTARALPLVRSASAVTPTAVVAVGGNALTREGEEGSYQQQRENARSVASAIVGLVDAGYRVAVTHGNGPQVGRLALQQERAGDMVPPQPLFVLGAMTQGHIGHVLASALRDVIGERPIEPVVVVPPVVVAPADGAFARPTKPIGPFFSREQAYELAGLYGWQMEDDAHRGFRRMVPSPAPQAIVEGRAVRLLVDAGFLRIPSGGGGVPTVPAAGEALPGP